MQRGHWISCAQTSLLCSSPHTAPPHTHRMQIQGVIAFFLGLSALQNAWALPIAHDPPITHFVYFKVAQGTTELGTIKLGLFGSALPLTVKNFYTLATEGFDGKGYKDIIFHRVIKDFMIQGGDFEKFDGTGGYSIYGAKFADEGFPVKHDKIGRVSMANSGPDSNGSQFFITTSLTEWLDGKHVVFGQVVDGMSVVDEIQNSKVNKANKPDVDVKVVESWGEPNKEVTISEVKEYEEEQLPELRTGNELWILFALIVLIVIYMFSRWYRSQPQYASMRD